MYVCVCHAVTERAVREAVAAGVRSLEELAMKTGCGGTCGSCRELAQELIDQVIPEYKDV